MLKLSAISFAALVLLQSPCGAAEAPPPVPALAQADAALAGRLDALIAPMFKADAPGATVIVTRAGVPLFRKAYGMADVGKRIAMTPDMALRIGSMTKQFTAAGILLLAEEGKLAVTDDITKYLPDYPTHGKSITLAHLLNHTSGIVNYTDARWFGLTANFDKTVPQVIGTFKDQPLEFDPGTRYAYSNSGYFLLGAVIEKVSGQPYAKFVEQRFFIPLGMNQTSYEGHERGDGARAAGHTQAGMFSFGKAFESSWGISMTLPFAAGALVSSVDDLARWDAALVAGKVLKPASLQKAWTPVLLSNGRSTHYGYGWHVGSLRGAPMIDHGGNIHGFASFALRLPEQQLYVAVLSNADSGIVRAETVALKAGAAALGKPFPEPKAVVLDPKVLASYEGSFRSDDMVTRSFRRDGGTLVMERSGRKTVLIPYAENAFFIDNSVNHVEFTRDAKGAVTEATMFVGDEPTVHKRIATGNS